MYNTRISNSILKPSTNYTVKCTVVLTDGQSLEQSASFQTTANPSGNFSIDPDSGYGIETEFRFKIRGWNQLDLGLPFTYQISYKIDENIVNWNRFADSGNYPNLKRLDYEGVLKLPYVSSLKTVKVTLRVSNILSETVISKDILLNPTNAATASEFLKNNSNTQSLDSLSLLSKSLLSLYSHQVSREITSREEEMKKTINKFYEYSCDSVIDCSGNGFCLSNIKNFKIKCNCKEGWRGRSCTWKAEVIFKTRAVIYGIKIFFFEENFTNLDFLN